MTNKLTTPEWIPVGDGFEFRADATGLVRRRNVPPKVALTVTLTPDPRPATAEPPAWKGWSMPEIIQEQLAQPSIVVHTPDPIAEFNARRIAKREEFAADAKERASWWNSLETVEDAVNTLQLSRAMSLDLHHTISDLIRPWRGK